MRAVCFSYICPRATWGLAFERHGTLGDLGFSAANSLWIALHIFRQQHSWTEAAMTEGVR